MIALGLACALAGPAPQDDLRPVVRIQVEKPKSVGYGSGFFIDSAGAILTNYHVIREADRIAVSGEAVPRHNAVRVERLWPHIDLAQLRLECPPGTAPVPFYALPAQSPGAAVDLRNEPLTLVALLEGSSSARAEQVISREPSPVEARTIRGPGSVPIFEVAAEHTPMLLLRMTTYHGMSGSPVLWKGNALGVFCGSRNQGTGFTWAIPTHLLADSDYGGPSSAPQCAAAAISVWPAQGLIDPLWTSSDPRITMPRLTAGDRERATKLCSAFDRLAEAVDAFDRTRRRIAEKLTSAKSALLVFAKGQGDADIDARLSDLIEASAELSALSLADVANRAERRQQLSEIHASRSTLKPAIRQTLASLETDLRSDSISPGHYLRRRLVAMRAACEATPRLDRIMDTADRRLSTGFERLNRALYPRPGATAADRIDDLVAALRHIEAGCDDATAPDTLMLRNETVRQLREFCDITRELCEER